MIAWIRRVLPTEVVLRVLPWLIALSVLGLFDFVEMRFDINRITTPEYVAEVSIMLMLSIFIFAYSLVFRGQELKEEDGATKKLEASVHTTLSTEDTGKLQTYITTIENPTRQVTAYKEKMRYEKQKALRKATPEDIRIWNEGTKEEQEINKFCGKMRHIERITSDEYIEKNQIYLDVKYPEIKIGFVQSGYQSKEQMSTMEKPSSPVKTAVTDNAFNFLLPIVVVAFVISMILSTSDAPRLVALAKISIKVGLLIIQFYNAQFYAPRFISLTWVSDVNLRYNLLLRYIAWKKNGKEVPTDAREGQERDEPVSGRSESRLQQPVSTTSAGVL